VARTYAGILGPLALAVSLVRGLLAGGGTESVLWTAWCHFLLFAAIGGVLGWIAQRVVADSVNGRIAAELEGQTKKPASTSAPAGAAG
jgi:hypothetical protein